jgi:hypothetical protein
MTKSSVTEPNPLQATPVTSDTDERTQQLQAAVDLETALDELRAHGVRPEHITLIAKFLLKHAEELSLHWSRLAELPVTPQPRAYGMSRRAIVRLKRDSIW